VVGITWLTLGHMHWKTQNPTGAPCWATGSCLPAHNGPDQFINSHTAVWLRVLHQCLVDQLCGFYWRREKLSRGILAVSYVSWRVRKALEKLINV